jgi:hypothetical protein
MELRQGSGRGPAFCNLTADCWDLIDEEGELRSEVALCWERKGRRYHLWLDPVSGGHLSDVLFCNPPISSTYGDRSSGYFATRLLDPTNKTNAPVVAAALARAGELGLIQAAYRQFAPDRAAYVRRRARARRRLSLTPQANQR